jgi:hypothetical protein
MDELYNGMADGLMVKFHPCHKILICHFTIVFYRKNNFEHAKRTFVFPILYYTQVSA